MDDEALIHSLPPELLCELLGYLEPRDLGRVSLVCRAWAWFLYDPASDFVWRLVHQRYAGLAVGNHEIENHQTVDGLKPFGAVPPPFFISPLSLLQILWRE